MAKLIEIAFWHIFVLLLKRKQVVKYCWLSANSLLWFLTESRGGEEYCLQLTQWSADSVFFNDEFCCSVRQDNSDINQFLFHMFVLLLFFPQDKWFKQELILLVSGCADSDWEVMPLAATLQVVNVGIVLINHIREQRKGSFRPSSPSSSFMYPKQIVLLGDDITGEKISSSEDVHLKLYLITCTYGSVLCQFFLWLMLV